MVKVDTLKTYGATGSRTGRKGGTASSFALGGPSSETSSVSSGFDVKDTVSISGLLYLQEVTDRLPQERLALLSYADAMLEALERLQMDILEGNVTYQSLSKIKERLENHPPASDDPRLYEIVAQIIQRAAIEMAKWEVSQRS
jgi:hypothetical protein